ncbi:MAG TPA: hypothetical protein VIJ66_03555 [Solirubrobacteraceae bacterium]
MRLGRGIQKRTRVTLTIQSCASLIAENTVAFHEVDGDGNTQPNETTWLRLAQAGDSSLGSDTKPRDAVIHMLGEMGVDGLAQAWAAAIKRDLERLDGAAVGAGHFDKPGR